MTRRLALCAAPQFLIAFEFSAITISIAPLAADLGISQARVPLVYATYSLAFGSLLLLSGRVADRVGPVRCVLAGLALFACGVLGVAAAPSVAVLAAARVIEGAGAAVIAPAALALTAASFPEPRARRTALSWYAAAISIGFVLGAVVAGLAGQVLGWRPAIASVGVCAVVALAGTRLTAWPARERVPAWQPDGLAVALVTGAAISGSVAVALLSAGLLTSAALVVTLLVTVVLAEASRRRGVLRAGILLPAGAGLGRGLSTTIAGGATVTATGVAGTLLLSLHLQDALSLSPLEAALVLAAFGLSAFRGRRLAASVADRRGRTAVLAAGLAIQGLALAALGVATARAAPVPVLVVLTAGFGLGHVVANAGVALCATAGPPESHGTAGGLVATAQYFGGALGPAGILATAATASAGLAVAGCVACLAGLLLAGVSSR